MTSAGSGRERSRARAGFNQSRSRVAAVFPFLLSQGHRNNPFLRELVIPFGSGGYVALFEIEARDRVSVLAARHQREEDYQ